MMVTQEEEKMTDDTMTTHKWIRPGPEGDFEHPIPGATVVSLTRYGLCVGTYSVNYVGPRYGNDTDDYKQRDVEAWMEITSEDNLRYMLEKEKQEREIKDG